MMLMMMVVVNPSSLTSSSDDNDVNDDGFIEAEGPDLYKNQNITKNIEKKQDQNALKDTQTKASNLIEEIEKIKKFLSEAQSKQMTIIREPLHYKSDHVENNDKEDESNDNNGVFWADVVIVDDDKSAIDINKNIIHMGDKPANETR